MTTIWLYSLQIIMTIILVVDSAITCKQFYYRATEMWDTKRIGNIMKNIKTQNVSLIIIFRNRR